MMAHVPPFRFGKKKDKSRLLGVAALFIGLVLPQELDENENGLTHTWLMNLYIHSFEMAAFELGQGLEASSVVRF
jgi:hypothetical protein